MLDLTFKRFHKTSVLKLNGELLSNYLNDFKYALMIALDNSERLIINLEKVTKLDKAYVQILCTAANVSKKLKKNFVVNTYTMRQKIKANSINCSLGCSFFKSGKCVLLRA